MSEEFSLRLRPNFEARIATGWLIAIPFVYWVMIHVNLPRMPFYAAMAGYIAMATWWVPRAIDHHRRMNALAGGGIEFYTYKDLKKKMDQNPGRIWLGRGFNWTNRHVQFVHEILDHDIDQLIEKWTKKKEEDTPGENWLHGVEDPKNEKDILLKQEMATLMTLIVGTTGAGKTRMFETFITQAVARDECVLVLDPKGDLEMRDTMRRACRLAGDEGRFIQCHLAYEDDSVRIDPISSYNDPTEIASRVSALATEQNAFSDFGFMVMNAIVNALILNGKKPSLKNIAYYLKGDLDGLVAISVTHYCERLEQAYPEMKGWRDDLQRVLGPKPRQGEDLSRAYSQFYKERVHPDYPSDTIIELLRLVEHNRDHAQKMIVSTSAILSKLVSGAIGKILSPDPTDTGDTRPITDLRRVVEQRKVLYVGLNTLGNQVVGQAFGAILLAELSAITGQIYNYGGIKTKSGRRKFPAINIFVDEAAETVNDSLIQILNKGRGANFRVYLAVQTINDFVKRFKDEAAAMQMLGNLNTLIALRTTDPKSQEIISQRFAPTKVKEIQRAQGSSLATGALVDHGGSVGERLMSVESDLVTPQLLGMLPNLEYYASLPGGRCVKGKIPILVEKVAA